MQARKGDKVLNLYKIKVNKRETFLDYIMGGCEIKLSVAVDLTSSNEDKNIYPQSLHQTDNIKQNHYYQAMKIIGENLENYDSDRRMPLYGFGAIPKQDRRQNASHCFALNGDIGSPEVQGTSGMLECYKNALTKVQLHGPTYFNELLDQINTEAESCLQN